MQKDFYSSWGKNWEEEEEKEEAAEALHKIEAHEYLFIDKHT